MEEAFDKIQLPFMPKFLNKFSIEQKAIYDKTTATTKLNDKKIKVFPKKSGTIQACTWSPLLFNRVLDILDREVREGKEIKCI